jgi:outer membrane protein assembly factor BamB
MKFAFCRRPTARPLSLLGCAFFSVSAGFADWPQYRGPTLDGVYRGQLRTNWSELPPVEVWRTPLDPGLSSMAVAGGRVFTLVRRALNGQQREFVVALDAETGAELWATVLGIAVYASGGVGPDDGPRSTPAVTVDRVVILSSYLKLVCLNVATGAEVWSKDLGVEYGGLLIPWENAASPIIVDGLVMVNGNGPGQRLLAFHLEDGTLAWKGHDDGMTHATPVTADFDGTQQVIFFAQSGLVAVAPGTGDVLWRHPLNYNDVSVAASPVVEGNRIFASRANPASLSSARAGAVVIELQRGNAMWSTSEVWYRTNQFMSHWSTPVLRDGHVYGHFGQSFLTFKCVELATGVEKWSQSGYGYGSVLLAGDDLLALSGGGDLVLVAADPDTYTERARFRPLNGKCWNVPAISNGRIYVRSTLEAVCLDVASTVAPGLRLLTVPVVDGDGFRFTVVTEDGSPIGLDRAANVEVQAASELNPTAGTWTRLTNGVVVTENGIEVHDPEDPAARQRYFRVLDQQP